MSDFVQRMVDDAAWKLAAQREDVLREAARERLPRGLRWAVSKPRVLAVLYRLRGTWRPTISYGVDGGVTVACVQRADGTIAFVETFTVTSEPRARDALDQGAGS
jgi:hypothetical protein